MKDFIFKMPTRVIFGVNATERLKSVLDSYGLGRIMIVTGPHIAKTEEFQTLLRHLEREQVEYTVYKDIESDPCIEAVDASAQKLRESGADGVVAVGGGSVIDISKAMCMLVTNEGSVRDYLFGGTKTVVHKPLPLIAVPTTAGSGSEVTASSVITDNQHDIKLSVTHDFLMPLAAVIDPVMHRGMPPVVTASTGMDALTHAIESYVSLNAEPMNEAFAEKAIQLIGENIRKATYDPTNLEARSNMAIASTIAAAAFVNGGLGAVHGIAQSMGGVTHTPHGIANALLLPYVMELNIKGAPGKFAKIARLLGENTDGCSEREAAEAAVKAVRTLVEDLHIPTKLHELKIPVGPEMFDTIVKGTMEYRLLPLNPVKVREQDVYEILNKAL